VPAPNTAFFAFHLLSQTVLSPLVSYKNCGAPFVRLFGIVSVFSKVVSCYKSLFFF